MIYRFMLCMWVCGALHGAEASSPTPAQVLKRLMDGNARYVKDAPEHPNINQEARTQVATGQTPIAVIVGCSDSRVPPEIIFDQGIGDLFVVRTAGNVVGPIGTTSVDYGTAVLKAPLVIVLGHQNCGAVTAVLNGNVAGIQPIATRIQEALKQNIKLSDNPVENAVKLNVLAVVKSLRENEVIAKEIADRKVEVVGGYYDLSTGKIELLSGLQYPPE